MTQHFQKLLFADLSIMILIYLLEDFTDLILRMLLIFKKRRDLVVADIP